MSQNMLGSPGDELLGITHDFIAKLRNGTITPFQAKRFLRKENPWDYSAVNLDWRVVYEKLGLLTIYEAWAHTHASELVETSDTWAVPAVEGATPDAVVKATREAGVDFYLYTDNLNQNVPTNDRDPKNGSYVVRFAKNVEADPELAGRSANDLAQAKISGITLLERLLLEFAYFLAAGEHLDAENVTLCSGSRYSDGSVPDVDWRAGSRQVCVDWDYADDRRDYLRARAAVSC